MDKILLMKDLCPRLPYGVKCDHFGNIKTVLGVFYDIIQVGDDINNYEDTCIEDIKLYLRPMTSMTEEEKYELYGVNGVLSIDFEFEEYKMVHLLKSHNVIDWLIEHHFDYRGLIGRGLALEAPEGMY